MSERRQVWATLADLLRRVEAAQIPPATGSAPAELAEMKQEVRRLGKAQFKANALAETQAERWEEALALLRQRPQQGAPGTGGDADGAQELLAAILPALDDLEEAMASGERYLTLRDRAAESERPSAEERARLLSLADRAMLAGWLDGLRLVRERLLAILEKGEVTPIPTVGHAFDPYLHRAVGTTGEGASEPNAIVREERRGYQTPDGVLRYADVVVYKASAGESE